MVRIKERYILVNILYPPTEATASDPKTSQVPDFVELHQPTTKELTPRTLLTALRKEILTLFGDYGAGLVGGSLIVKYLSNATSTFILRVRRDHYRMVWAALTCMNRVPLHKSSGKLCTFKVVRVSGTIRKAEEEAIRQARQLVLSAKAAQSPGKGASTLSGNGRAMHGTSEDTLMQDVESDADSQG